MYLRAYTPWKIFSTCSLMWFFYLSKIPPLKSNTYVTKVPFCQTCFQVRTCRSRQASRLTIRAWPREHTIGNPPTGKHRVLTRMEIRWNQVQIHVPPTSTLDLPNVMWWVGVPKKALSAVSFLSRWWRNVSLVLHLRVFSNDSMTSPTAADRDSASSPSFTCVPRVVLGAPTLIDGQATLALTFLHCWSKWPRHCQKNKSW